MENADSGKRISIRRYNNSLECDVIVALRDREMVLRMPDYSRALKWAHVEARSYKLLPIFSIEQPEAEGEGT
jgi:hypothetical protein